VPKKFHGGEGDNWGWWWHQIRQQPRCNQQGAGCAEQRERPEVRALTVWQMKHTVTSTVQAAKEWQ